MPSGPPMRRADSSANQYERRPGEITGVTPAGHLSSFASSSTTPVNSSEQIRSLTRSVTKRKRGRGQTMNKSLPSQARESIRRLASVKAVYARKARLCTAHFEAADPTTAEGGEHARLNKTFPAPGPHEVG